MLILAGIAISALGNNGLFSKSKEAVIAHSDSSLKEEINLLILDLNINNQSPSMEEILNHIQNNLDGSTGFLENPNSGIIVTDDGRIVEITNDNNLTVEIIGSTNIIVPIIEITPNTTTPAGNVILTVKIKEKINGISSLELLTVQNITYPDKPKETTETFNITENGTYKFKVTANNTNKSTEAEIIINNIDKSKPTATYTLNPTKDVWTSSVKITVTGSDENGIASIKKPDNQTIISDIAEHTVTANGTYTFIITDTFGNFTTFPVVVSNIDTTPPAITLTASKSNNYNYSIYTNITDNSGISIKKFAIGNQNLAYFKTAGTVLTNTLFGITENGIFTIYAKDNNGLESIKTINVTEMWINRYLGSVLNASAGTSKNGTTLIIPKNLFQFGPYQPYLKGTYEVTISGSNLTNVNSRCYKSGLSDFPITNKTVTSTQIKYSLNITQDVDKLEFYNVNNGDPTATINYIFVKRLT